MKKYLLVLFLLMSFSLAYGNTEPIMITISNTMKDVVFDGKWTTQSEWKSSSWNELKAGDSIVQLRTAHQEDFIYVMVDYVTDTSIDTTSDKAVVCLTDKNGDDINGDFCFVAYLGSVAGQIYTIEPANGSLKILDLAVEEFVAVGGVSDDNDRYSDIPHTGYEFKIPTDLVGRSDSYGFFISVYDSASDVFFTWPYIQGGNNSLGVVPQDMWGQIISPDKSLPEFDLPLLILLPSLALVFYLTRNKS
ncbi:MAG: hypothetical protein WAO91_09945 [Candidatus Nitrosotenuis sp.]